MADSENKTSLSGIGSLVQAGWNIFDSLFGISSGRQKKTSKELMELQQMYNEKNMALEQQYAKEMFDYQGPAHQMELAAAAGLNPLSVVDGNMNLGSASSASSDGVDPAAAASAAAQMESVNLQRQMQIAQIMNINSQTALNNENVKKTKEETLFVTSTRQINEKQSEMTLALDDYQLNYVLPSEVAKNKAAEQNLIEITKKVQPEINLLRQQYAIGQQQINNMKASEKAQLAETWMKLDKHGLEKMLLRAGVSKAQSDMLVNQANIDYIHLMGENLKKTGTLMDFQIKYERAFGMEKAYHQMRSLEISNRSLQIDSDFRFFEKNDAELTNLQSQSLKNFLSPVSTFLGLFLGLKGLGTAAGAAAGESQVLPSWSYPNIPNAPVPNLLPSTSVVPYGR